MSALNQRELSWFAAAIVVKCQLDAPQPRLGMLGRLLQTVIGPPPSRQRPLRIFYSRPVVWEFHQQSLVMFL